MTNSKTPQKLYRDLLLNRDAINIEARTVELAFSSELAYERWFGMEILDHAPSSIRLDRLKDGAPLLVNHDPDCQVGVVDNVSIGTDRVGRSVVRFGKSEQADAIFQDVIDGIRRKVSVGYMVHNMSLESREGDVKTYRVDDWEPYEISIVSIPADSSVGVGRNLEQPPIKEEKKMTDTVIAEPVKADPSIVSRAADEARENARKEEMKRIADLESIGQSFSSFGGVELARQMIKEGKTVDALNAALLERTGKVKPVETAQIGMNEKEVRKYSLVKVMNALANPSDRAAQEAASFEIECSLAASSQRGRETKGILVPYDVLAKPFGDVSERTLVTATGSSGGYTVQTNLITPPIEILRNRLATMQMGAQMLTGLTGNIAIPRQTGASTAYWVGEDTAPTGSQQTLDQVTLNPKTVGTYTDYSRKLLIQSSIDVEGFIRNDLMKVLALEIDRVAIYGTGASTQPLGVRNTTGIGSKSLGVAQTPTYGEVVDMETLVAAANADVGTLAYLTNATIRGKMKQTPKVTAQPIYLWEPDSTVNGYKAVCSNQVSANDIWFGNWADLLIGMWSGLDLLVDPYTGSNKGTVRINVLQDIDVAVRHPVSFVRAA